MCAYFSAANAGQVGTFDCVDCQGLLEVKRVSNTMYSAKLVVGGGSCGGTVVAKGTSRLSEANELSIPYKMGKKRCFSKIAFIANGANVSDTCRTPAMEEYSTCATLGEYKKR